MSSARIARLTPVRKARGLVTEGVGPEDHPESPAHPPELRRELMDHTAQLGNGIASHQRLHDRKCHEVQAGSDGEVTDRGCERRLTPPPPNSRHGQLSSVWPVRITTTTTQ